MIKKWVGIICLIFMMVTTVVWAKPDSAYIDNGNGTVTDIETKLMWQQATAFNKMDWNYADSRYCESVYLAGYAGWRLPALVDELETLLDFTQTPTTINQMYFPDTAASWYWSSTTHANHPGYAWVVYFNSAPPDYYDQYDDMGYVRVVRGGQAGSLDNLVISSLSQTVTTDAGSITFGVSNNGSGLIPWRAAVTAGADWLSISSGAAGTDTGTITCAYTANTSTSSRTGTIQVTAYGGTDTVTTGTLTSTQKYVTVTQYPPIGGGGGPPTTTACTATIKATKDGNLLQIPYLLSGTLSRWADLGHVFNPTYPMLILFKLTNYGVIENPSFSCEASTLSNDFKIHIPDVLLPDGITHLWVDMEYSQALSTDVNVYFEVTKFGVVSN